MKSNLVHEPVRSRMTVAGLVVGSLAIWACGNGTTSVDVNQVANQVATQLAFTVEPTTTIVASSIMPAVQVAIQGARGTLVAGATDAVTVAIGTNPGGGTLSGTTTVNAVAGVASFTDLTIDQVGTGYTLVATSGSLSSATSAAFGIFPPPLGNLHLRARPNHLASPTISVSAMWCTSSPVSLSLVDVTTHIGRWYPRPPR